MPYKSLTEETVHRLDNALIQTGEALEEFMHIHMSYRGQMVPSELLDVQGRIHRAHWSLMDLRKKHYEVLEEAEGKGYYGDGSRYCHECRQVHEDSKLEHDITR